MDRTEHVALVQVNKSLRGNLRFMPFKRHNKMPAKGTLATGLKLPRHRDVV
ncbi:hypothetical protein [Pseudomonas vancouverensis]|uniref:hypothetical protein n=1 Tax=Pseudomonas vancouverensis TaxID=95300 RepID=UPI0012FE4B35|nr:hypothetical protein [Pseudomonas vancouverensis]